MSGFVDPQPSPYPAAGEIIDGKYKIEKILGEGGMGAVARATHVVLGGTLALKFMNPQFMTFPGAVERFVNEGRASKAIKSDHVLPVNEIGLLPNGAPYLCMECLYGLDLADLLARDGPSGLPIQRAVHFTVQILRGLQSAHAINIIHRDMKPANCFVITHDGEDDFIKILDFGISKIQQPGASSLTQTNSALGTPLYMSPEQARSPRDVDHRSDIYSVGVILYELLCGRTPFFSESGEFTEILFQLFTAEPPPIRQTRPDIPEGLAFVVHKALAREVVDRYSTAVELADALAPFAAPKTLALIERMRNFRPPTAQSIAPGDGGLPTSMDALSQLRQGGGHGTEHMANRPTTDVQKGAPVTAVIEAKPMTPAAQSRTAVLEGKGPAPGSLDRTQFDPNVGTAKNKPGAATDGGQAVDQALPEQKRSPLIYALPAVVALAIGAGAFIFVVKSNADKPGGTSPSSAPPSAVLTIPSAPASTTVVEAPSAKPTATPSAAVSVAEPSRSMAPAPAPAPRPAPPPKPVGDPALNQNGHW
jgi:serine/threonine-protein kinase